MAPRAAPVVECARDLACSARAEAAHNEICLTRRALTSSNGALLRRSVLPPVSEPSPRRPASRSAAGRPIAFDLRRVTPAYDPQSDHLALPCNGVRRSRGASSLACARSVLCPWTGVRPSTAEPRAAARCGPREYARGSSGAEAIKCRLPPLPPPARFKLKRPRHPSPRDAGALDA